MIKSIISDLGGVYFTAGTKQAVKKISKKYNLNSEEVSKFFGTKSEFGRLYRQGKIVSKKYWIEFEKMFGVKVNKEELTKLWISCHKPIKGTINLIKKLRKKGIKIYFLSDNVKERSKHLQNKFKFLEDFDDGVFSHKVGLTKSDGIKVFKMALQKTRNKPSEVLFIDDEEDYVKTARILGMNAIHFKNAKQLEREIKQLLN